MAESATYRKLLVDDLQTFAGNPRRGNVDAIAKSIDRHGLYRLATVLERDITDTLTKLRRARHLGDRREEKACQDRLDRLLDRIERRP